MSQLICSLIQALRSGFCLIALEKNWPKLRDKIRNGEPGFKASCMLPHYHTCLLVAMLDVQNFIHKVLAVIFAEVQHLYRSEKKLVASSIEWYHFPVVHSMYGEITFTLIFSHTNFHWIKTQRHSACTVPICKIRISAWRPFNGTNCGITFQ